MASTLEDIPESLLVGLLLRQHVGLLSLARNDELTRDRGIID